LSRSRKKNSREKSLSWATIAGVLLIMAAAALYLVPDLPERLDSLLDFARPEREEMVEEAPEVKEEAREPRPEGEISDPFEEREENDQEAPEDEDQVGDEAQAESAESAAVPGQESGDWEDLKVISDGDYLLALVTKETTLKRNYVPTDLEAVPARLNPYYPMQLRSEALRHLEKLWEAARDDGVALSIRSAYRSYQTQKELFRDYVSRHGEAEANRFSARPGQSEHQLGTTVDFGGTGADFTAAFADTKQGRWLVANAHRYGFAKSYPAGKEHITGYIYEPWHYRYIGVERAGEWKASGLTLKEYLQQQPQQYE